MSDETPKKRAKGSLKSYGRQSDGKTIKSLSLDKNLVELGEAEAKAKGISFSQWVNDLLGKSAPTTKGSVAPIKKGRTDER